MNERLANIIDREVSEYEQQAAAHKQAEIEKADAMLKAGKLTRAERDELVKEIGIKKIEAVRDYANWLEDQYTAINY